MMTWLVVEPHEAGAGRQCGAGALGSFGALDLRYRSTALLWWQAVAGIMGVTSSTALRRLSPCTWRPSEGARNVDTTAIRYAMSPWRSGGSVTADVHGYPRGGVPIRPPLAIWDTRGRTRETTRLHRLTMPREPLPIRPPSCRLLTACALEAMGMTVHERNDARRYRRDSHQWCESLTNQGTLGVFAPFLTVCRASHLAKALRSSSPLKAHRLPKGAPHRYLLVPLGTTIDLRHIALH